MTIDLIGLEELEQSKAFVTTLLKALFDDTNETDPRLTLLTQLEQAIDFSTATTLFIVWKEHKKGLAIDEFVVLISSLEGFLQFCEKINSQYLKTKVGSNEQHKVFYVYNILLSMCRHTRQWRFFLRNENFMK